MAKLQANPTMCDHLSYATTYPKHQIFPSEITGTYEPTIDVLPTSVAS